MAAGNNLEFLKERIFEIKSALLYSMSNELIKMPVSIVTVLKMDDEGMLWFFVKKPSCSLSEDGHAFPARMQFYRKGKPFFMHVTGTAIIDDCPQDLYEVTGMQQEEQNTAIRDILLIKLKITKAEYYEQKQQSNNHSIIGNFFQNIYSSLFKPSGHYRPFELNTAA
ncbi:MAG: hypothetical protein QM764_11710 [Chitinophagaceae bacterium]